MKAMTTARLRRLEAILKPKPTISATDEAWIRENCDDAPFLVSVVKSCLSGEFSRGLFGASDRGPA